MLGSMVVKYFSTMSDCQLETTNLRWPTGSFKKYITDFSAAVVINCIGTVPQRASTFSINFELPIWLEQNAPCPIVHAGTDCDGGSDGYGMSKKKASDYLLSDGQKTKSIKASIIGPEPNNKKSLLEWLLNSEGSVKGYTSQMWNGVTTLQWSKICWSLVNNYDTFARITIPYSECISKFALLTIIKDVYQKDINIVGDNSIKVNKCLDGNLQTPDIKTQITELRTFSLL